jgi:hypothetical protein
MEYTQVQQVRSRIRNVASCGKALQAVGIARNARSSARMTLHQTLSVLHVDVEAPRVLGKTRLKKNSKPTLRAIETP